MSWNAQTSPLATTSHGYEVAVAASYLSNLTGALWTARGVVAVVGADGESLAVTYTPPSAAAGVVIGARYLWQESPHSFILYSNGGGTGTLPAQPWIAQCDASACNRIAPGRVPSSATPTPAPPVPAPGPVPPAPPSSACAFVNNTEVTHGTILGELSVAFLDQDACCGACRAFAQLGRGECAVAQLMGSGTTHGTPSEWHSKCILYGADGVKDLPHPCAWPCARVEIQNS